MFNKNELDMILCSMNNDDCTKTSKKCSTCYIETIDIIKQEYINKAKELGEYND